MVVGAKGATGEDVVSLRTFGTGEHILDGRRHASIVGEAGHAQMQREAALRPLQLTCTATTLARCRAASFFVQLSLGAGGGASRWGHSAATRGRRGRQVEVPSCKKSGAKSRQLLLAPSLRVLAAAEISIRRVISSEVPLHASAALHSSILLKDFIRSLDSSHALDITDSPKIYLLASSCFVKSSLLTSEVAVRCQHSKCETEPIYS